MPSPPKNDKANAKAREISAKAMERVKDRRRVRIGRPVSGLTGIAVHPDTEVTLYPSTIRTPRKGEPVLMSGINSPKLGGDVLVGRLKGAALYYLTLEERRTCPRSCFHWTTCYGNSSPFITRWKHGPELEAALKAHVVSLLRKRPLLVRLHMLGDFYSWEYLCLWAGLLDEHPNLYTFGFTAHRRGTKMGDGIARLRAVYPDRFAIRHSGELGAWGSATVDFPTERRFIGDAIVCPEQLDANKGNPKGTHCGSCAACWQTERAVIFMEHGERKSQGGQEKQDAETT